MIVFLALWVVPSSEYIFLPDPAHPVAPLVTVQGGHNPTQGSVYFVDVLVRKATLLERLFGGLHEGAELVPASEVDPPGSNVAQRDTIDVEDMQRSQEIAAAVALRALGRKVVERPIGALVDDVAAGRPPTASFEPDDIVTAVERNARDDVRPRLAAMSEGQDRRRRQIHDPAGRQDAARDDAHRRGRRTRGGRSSASSLGTATDIQLPIRGQHRRRQHRRAVRRARIRARGDGETRAGRRPRAQDRRDRRDLRRTARSARSAGSSRK